MRQNKNLVFAKSTQQCIHWDSAITFIYPRCFFVTVTCFPKRNIGRALLVLAQLAIDKYKGISNLHGHWVSETSKHHLILNGSKLYKIPLQIVPQSYWVVSLFKGSLRLTHMWALPLRVPFWVGFMRKRKPPQLGLFYA